MAQRDLPGVWPQYLEQIGQILGAQYQFAGQIAQGRTGTAYKIVRLDSAREYCLKTVSENVTGTERDSVRDTLKKEVEILDPLDHRCIPKVYERDFASVPPFYVCTFHAGQTFQDFKASGKRFTRDEAIYIVQSLIDTFDYLHQHGRTHCDFHHKNILIGNSVFAQGVLVIDFGSGHRDSDSAENTPERGDLRFKDVAAQARYRDNVRRDDAAASFRLSDFVAFGHLLALMQDVFFRDAPNDQRIAYADFCRLLESGQLSTWTDVRHAFAAVIDPRCLISAADRFFILPDGTRGSIRIPVSKQVPVGEASLAIIDTKVFQRLRVLKQLSFCDWVYPGGRHSRFEHSLGFMEMVYSALQRLSLAPDFRDQFTARNIEGTLLAALVHDIGHYPFAHVMEHYVSSRFTSKDAPEERERNQLAKDVVSHSRNTIDLLEHDQELREAAVRHWSAEHVTEAIKVLEGTLPLLSDLLDSPIDCDKLDYVRRDSYHCGVEHGRGIDALSIVSAYCSASSGQRLGSLAVGVQAIEGFMVAQEHMLATVYWNEHIRAITAMFHAVVASIVRTDIKKLESLVTGLKACTTEDQAIEKVLLPELAKLSSEHTPSSSQLSRLLDLHRVPSFADIYRPIAKYTVTDPVPHKTTVRTSIYTTIVSTPLTGASMVPISWKAIRFLRECFLDAFHEKNAARRNIVLDEYDILIDVPWGKAGNRNVTIRNDDGSEQLITTISHLNETIFSRPTAFLAPVRVYISPRAYRAYEGQLRSIVQSAEEHFYSNRA